MKQLLLICILWCGLKSVSLAIPPKLLHTGNTGVNIYSDDLPLKLIPATKKSNLPVFFMISGDGGWTSFDQSFAEALAAKGVPVVGLDAQKYFWSAKTPEKTAEELSKAISHYMAQLNKDKVVLVGYSFGGSIVPFIANRLPAALKAQLAGVLAISPDVLADFEIHVADMLNFGGPRGKYNVVAEMKKAKALQPVVFFGKSEGNSIAGHFIKEGCKTVILPGNHHYGNDFHGLSEAMIKNIDINQTTHIN